MIKKAFLFTAMLLFLPQVSFAAENGDFQYAHRNAVALRLTKDIEFSAFNELGFDNNAGNLYAIVSDLGIHYYGFADWLDVGVHHRIIPFESESDWDLENRTYLDFIFKFPLWGLELSDKNRFEFRAIENRKFKTRYRNKLKIELPFEIGKRKIRPYIADEVFLNVIGGDGLDRNRVYSGIVLDLFTNTRLNLQYFWQIDNDNEDSVTSINVVRTFLTVSF